MFSCLRWWSSFDIFVFEDVKPFESETCGRVFATVPDFYPKWGLRDLSAASQRLDMFVCTPALQFSSELDGWWNIPEWCDEAHGRKGGSLVMENLNICSS